MLASHQIIIILASRVTLGIFLKHFDFDVSSQRRRSLQVLAIKRSFIIMIGPMSTVATIFTKQTDSQRINVGLRIRLKLSTRPRQASTESVSWPSPRTPRIIWTAVRPICCWCIRTPISRPNCAWMVRVARPIADDQQYPADGIARSIR